MRLTCSLGQLESIAILMEDAILEAELRGHAEPDDPVVRLRALPAGGVGVTVIINVPGLATAELREVLLDRIGRTVVLPTRPQGVQLDPSSPVVPPCMPRESSSITTTTIMP